MGSPTQGRADEATICLQCEILLTLQAHNEKFLQHCHAPIYSVSGQSHYNCSEYDPLTLHVAIDYTNDTEQSLAGGIC